jgi:hypothetical protein
MICLCCFPWKQGLDELQHAFFLEGLEEHLLLIKVLFHALPDREDWNWPSPMCYLKLLTIKLDAT